MLGKISNLRLKNQILLINIIYILFIVILGIYLYLNINSILSKKVYNSTEQLLIHIEKEILNYFNNIENISYTIEYLPSSQKLFSQQDATTEYLLSNEINKYVISLFLSNDTITGVSLQLNYKIFKFDNFSIPIGDTREMDFGKSKRIITGLISYKSINSMNSNENKKNYFAVIRKLGSSTYVFNKKSVGNIAVILSRKFFIDICSRYDNTSNSNIFIINNHNEIVSSPKSQENNIGQKIIQSDIPEDKSTIIYHNDVKYITHMRYIDDTGWRIVSIIPHNEFFKELNISKTITLIIFIIVIIIILPVSVYITGSITSPVKTILETMNKVRKGNLEEKCPVCLNNEIGEISIHFNEMMSEVYNLTQKIVNTQKKLYEMEIANKDARLLALQSQINPHFLYNALASIQSMVLSKKTDNITKMTKSLAQIFRYSIKENDYVMVSAELENLKSYVLIHQLRTNYKFNFILDIEPDILGCTIMKLSLQPIVENAINHGIMNKTGKSVLKVEGFRTDDFICFKISDNGVGIPPKQVDELNLIGTAKGQGGISQGKPGSIGVLNVKQRLRLCYDDNYKFNIKSTLDVGTEVSIYIPETKGDV